MVTVPEKTSVARLTFCSKVRSRLQLQAPWDGPWVTTTVAAATTRSTRTRRTRTTPGPAMDIMESQPEDLGQPPGAPVVVVAGRQVGRGRRHGRVRVGHGIGRPGPAEHRQVVGHVTERDHLLRRHAELGTQEGQ